MLTKFVDEKFPKWAKILLAIFGAASMVYRIFIYVDDCTEKKEKKNVKALVAGILCVIPLVSLVLAILDIITLVTSNKFEYFTFRE